MRNNKKTHQNGHDEIEFLSLIALSIISDRKCDSEH